MGTKNKPGEFDCYDQAQPDEPMFVLLARDASAPLLVEQWALARVQRIGDFDDKAIEAMACCVAMAKWKANNPDV